MKKIQIKWAMMLAIAMMMLFAIGAFATETKAAAPAVTRNTYMEIFAQRDMNNSLQMYTGAQADLFTANIAPNAVVKAKSGLNGLGFFASYNTRIKKWSIVVTDQSKTGYYGKVKQPVGKTQRIYFTVKQGGKTYTLTTVLIWRYMPYPIYNLKIGSTALSNNYYYKTGKLPIYKLGTNKHPAISFGITKAYVQKKIFKILRGGKAYTYTSTFKLRKGDIIQIYYAKAGWAKASSMDVLVW